MILFPIRSWLPCRRRVLAAITLASYLATIFGLPLPAAARKDADQPFPCQDNPCGCQTAEQCWTSCCCFSPEQRLAWARERNIEPPPNAEKPGSVRWENLRKRDQGAKRKPTSKCCSEGGCEHSSESPPETPHRCCQIPADPNAPSSNPNEESDGPEPESNAPEDQSDESGLTWVLGMSALACQGNGSFMNGSLLSLPAAPHTDWQPSIKLTDRIPSNDHFADPIPTSPDSPPPRSSR